MNHGAFSLFHWTLRRDVRLMRTHLMRGAFVGVMLLAMFMAWVRTASVGAAGLNLFTEICWMNIAASTLAGISYFSTCVTEESEGGNLGLLKLAGMGAFSILLGKSTSRLIGALMLLVVQFPFTLLAITLGGVTLVQIVSAYAAIGAHLILVANLALFFSVYCQSSGRAAAWTGLALILFYSIPAIVGFAAPAMPAGKLVGSIDFGTIAANLKRCAAFQLDMSVIERIDVALSARFNGPVISQQVVYSLGIAVALFLLACIGFERATYRQGTPQRATLSKKQGSARRLIGVSRAWQNALAWKEFNFLTGGRTALLVRSVLFTGLWFLIYLYGEGDRMLTATTITSVLVIVLSLEVLIFASRVLFDETRWGTLSLLLTLPISSRAIVWQKTWGCLLATAPAIVSLLVTACIYPTEVASLSQTNGLHLVAVNLLLIIHFTVLFSLFMRWAALPAAFCMVLAFNTCCPVLSIGLILHEIVGETGGWVLAVVTFITYWILLLLPLQVEIVSRVDEAARHEYGK